MGSPKKVEFASTHLEPIDSEAPTEGGTIASGLAPQPSGAWDTEAGGCVEYLVVCDIPAITLWCDFAMLYFVEANI